MAAVTCFAALLWLTAAPSRALAACGNPVACENQLPGDPPSDWQANGIGDSTIQGYATQFSVNVGQTISFKIKTPSTSYHMDILRLGYYGGDGARLVAANLKPTATLPQTQPACQAFSSTGLIDCGNSVGLCLVDGAEHRNVRGLHRALGARRRPGSGRGEPDSLRRP